MASDEEHLVLSISADTRQILRAIKRLEGDIGKSAGQIEKSFDGIGKGIDKSINSTVQKRINEITGVGVQATKEWTGALADQGKELERMRSRFNPIFATVTRYKATVGEIQQAHRLGAISADEMAQAISRERQAALSSIAALKQRNAVLADTPSQHAANVGAFNTANIAAQFQDIGVTAAMGMSPLQIALQQGTQLSAVLNSMGNARGVISGLGAAFASIINPVSLVTIGVVGLTAAALQYFASFMDGSEDSEEALKAQADLIQKVADKWGDALPSIKAYANEQERIAQRGEIKDATANVVEKAWKDARDRITETSAAVFDVVGQLGRIPEYQNGVVELQRSFKALTDGVSAGKTESTDLERVTAALNDLYRQTSIPVVADLAEEFSNLADQITKANQAATVARAEAALKNLQTQLPALGTIGPVYSSGGKFIDEAGLQTVRADATKSQYQIEQERLARQKGAGAHAPRRTADDRFFEDIEAIRQRTHALSEEQAMLGKSFEEQTRRRVAFDLEQTALKQVREEARRKGEQDWQNAQLSPEQRRTIDDVSEAYARQAEALRKAQEEMGFQRDVVKGMMTDLRSAWADGKIEAEEWGDIVLNVLDKVINKIEDELIDAIFEVNSGSGSGVGFLGSLLGGLLGGGGGGFKPNTTLAGFLGVPGFAKGTNSAPGGLAIVGEKGPELVNLPSGSQVIPNNMLRNLPSMADMQRAAGSVGPQVTYAPVYNVPNATAETWAKVEQLRARDKAEMPAVIIKTIRDAQKRRIL